MQTILSNFIVGLPAFVFVTVFEQRLIFVPFLLVMVLTFDPRGHEPLSFLATNLFIGALRIQTNPRPLPLVLFLTAPCAHVNRSAWRPAFQSTPRVTTASRSRLSTTPAIN